jgi:hypothetical protein
MLADAQTKLPLRFSLKPLKKIGKSIFRMPHFGEKQKSKMKIKKYLVTTIRPFVTPNFYFINKTLKNKVWFW